MSRHHRLPQIAGARLPFGLHGTTGSVPTDATTADFGKVGETIAWNWNLPKKHWKANRVPGWLRGLYTTDEEHTDKERSRFSHFNWWLVSNAGAKYVQEKSDPIYVYNTTPGTLVNSAWLKLDLVRNEKNRWYTCAEVEFYESVETASSARLRVRAKTAGSLGNLIATTETLTGGAWASATLTGGADSFHNIANGETARIGSVLYTFVTGALDATGKVKIGSDGLVTLVNFVQAINAGTGAGVLYATGTTAHAQITASAGEKEGSIDITARATVDTDVANAIGVSSAITFGNWSVNGGATTLTGGVSGLYAANPGFSFSSIVSALDQGAQGLEVVTSSDIAEVTMPDLRNGLWDKAVCTIKAVNWAAPSGGAITLFGGRIGKIVYDDQGYVSISVDNQMSRNRQWPAETWSPTCRANLGDERCKFDIESMARVFTIDTVVSQTEIRSLELGSSPANYYMNGIIEILSGPNAGIAVELVYSSQTTSSTGGSPADTITRASGQVKLNVDKKVLTLTVTTPQICFVPTDGATLTIDGKPYTFKAVLTTGNGAVQIDGHPGGPATHQQQTTTLQNLADAINLAPLGASPQYGSATTLHPTVLASFADENMLTLWAKIPGTGGNSITLSSSYKKMIVSHNLMGGGGGAVTGTGAATATAYDTLKLAQAFPFTLTGGTLAKVWPGCQKRFQADCHDRFRNTVNFRGEPFAPTSDGLKTQ